MTENASPIDVKKQRANWLVAGVCLAFFGGMVGMAYAAVPLYAMFCNVTGYGGTTQRVTQYSDRILDRKITIRFDANVSGGLPWEFRPAARDMTMKIGETAEAHYTAANLFDTPTAGRATYNVTPEIAGSYFNKVECFCFTDTTLKPGQTLDMPVVFYVDPDYRRRAGTEGHQHDHAFLYVLPDRGGKAAGRRAAGGERSNSYEYRRKSRGLTWQTRTHTQNRTTTITSSIRARGRSSAPSARSSWRSAALPGCKTSRATSFPCSA